MIVPSRLNYNMDGVMNNCSSKALASNIDELCYDLNELVKELNTCEKNYHGKGSKNVIYTIYNNIGCIIGDYNYGYKQLVSDTVNVIDSDYNSARNDKAELQRMIEEERRRQEEERRRREEEERKRREEEEKKSNPKK